MNVNISAVGAWTGMCNGVASGIILSRFSEISVLQMFVKGYPINIYNSTSVIINCVSFFVYISWATIRVVLFWPFLLQIKAAKEFGIEGPDEKKITEFFPCLLHTNGKCVLSLYCLYTFHYAIKYTCAAWPENDKDPAFFQVLEVTFGDKNPMTSETSNLPESWIDL